MFDANGNVLFYVLKKDLALRRNRLRDYLAYLVKQGAISVAAAGQGLDARGQGAAAIGATIQGGRLTLERFPALRHANR